MHGTVMKLALAAIIAAAIFFMLAGSFSQMESASNTTIANMEEARMNSLANTAAYLQQ
jgi:hypothetical protein